eukprot:gene28292-34161_t
MYLIAVLLVVAWVGVECKKAPPANSVPMKVINHAGQPVNLYWIDMSNRTNLVSQTTKPLRNHSVAQINSYNGHEFMVKLRDGPGGTETIFVKGPSEETITIEYDEFEQKLKSKVRTKDDELMEMVEKHVRTCQAKANTDLADCLSQSIQEEVSKMHEVKDTVTSYRNMIASQLRTYTCKDENLTASQPESTKLLRIGDKVYNVSVFLDLEDAKIWSIDGFVTNDECDYLIDTARPLLSRATVSGEDGKDAFSEHRKAQQASFDLGADGPEKEKLGSLYSRILAVVNQHASYSLTPQGQEGLTVIQYDVGDEYTPHCDGACGGSFYKSGGRVATGVMYCQPAQKGGAVTFSNADVTLTPARGTGLFFAYKGADGKMDEGSFTEHSGCPVLAGEKWIATAWLREGVEGRGWEKYDPVGIEVLEEEENDVDMEVGMDGGVDEAEHDEF